MGESIDDQVDRMTVETQADLQRFWELVMRPLGFAGRSLWVVWVDPDRRVVRQVVEVAEGEEEPVEEEIDGFFELLHELTEDFAPDGSVALLLSRPGDGSPRGNDVRWARALLAGARRHDVPLLPLHLATDVRVLPIAPDDLAA